jgi:hypothetical protein
LITTGFTLALCVISCCEAQETREFYARDGQRLLSLSPGEGQERDIQLIRQLYYPRMSPAVRKRLQVLEADIYWRVQSAAKREISSERIVLLERAALEEGLVGILANISLADYLWVRGRELANFSRAKPFYDRALLLIAERGEPLLADLVEGIVENVVSPPWQKPRLPYGSLQNFLQSETLEKLRDMAPPALRQRLNQLVVRSLIQEGAKEEEVCSAFKLALSEQRRSPVKAEILFDFAQYVSVGERCGESSDALLKQLIRDYRPAETPYVERAKELIRFVQEGGWSLSVQNRRTGTQETVLLRGPEKGLAHLRIDELGLVTNEELERRKVALSPWTGSPGALLKMFSAPVKTIVDKQLGRGWVPASKTLPAGAYLAELVGRDERRFFLISDLLVLLKRSPQKIELLSVSLKTGTALPDVQIEVERRVPAGLKSRRVREVLQTNATGLAELVPPRRPCPVGVECESEELVIIGKKFRHTSFLALTDQSVIWPFQGDPSFWVVLSSDLPKRGELLSWNLFIRPDLLKRFTPGLVQVQLLHHRGPSLRQPESPVDPFGRAGGVIRLGSGWTPGKFELVYTLINRETGERVQESSFFELISE